jgi:hypothetical protein
MGAVKLSDTRINGIIEALNNRFESNMNRHPQTVWKKVEEKLIKNVSALRSLNEMEITGGEPDVMLIGNTKDIVFYDCSVQSPAGRRSLCYDNEAMLSRKENSPNGSAVAMAEGMGIELLTEDDYIKLQKIGTFDTKTSSWLTTPKSIRKLGGAIFGDCRYGRAFIYHNGAQSYYAARGFRGKIRI